MSKWAVRKLPLGWTEAELGRIADIRLGKMLDRSRTDGVALPYLRNINVRWGRIDTDDLLEMHFKPTELERYSIADGDVLVCEGGEPGRAAVWTGGKTELKYQKALHRVRLEGAVEPTWLVYQLQLDAGSGQLVRHFTGSTINHLTRESLSEYPVRIPPLSEQQRVLEELDSQLSRLEDTVATLERVQRNLKRYRASVLKAAVEGRLVPTEAELARREGRAYEPADVLLERILEERKARWIEHEAEKARAKAEAKAKKAGKRWTKAENQAALEKGRKAAAKKYKPPAPPDTSELPELPEGWCWTTVEAMAPLGAQNGLYVPKSRYGSGTPILRIDDYQVDWSRSAPELQRVAIDPLDATIFGLSKRDLVINRVNSLTHLGKSLAVEERHVPAVFESNMMRLATSTLVSVRFLQHYFSSQPGKARLTANAKWAVNQASINQGDVLSTPVPLAPREEQSRLVYEVARLLSAEDAASATCVRNSRAAARLRQSILKWAFEGKLVDQDPNDEPASVLLERIRAEREQAAASNGKKKTRRKKAGRKTKTA